MAVDRSGGAGRPWLVEWAVAGVATVIAASLTVAALTRGHALWRDEVNSVATASASSVAELWRLLEFESFPALWLVTLRGWMAVAGATDGALRLWGAAGLLALVAAIWLAPRRSQTHGIPLVGLALFAVNADALAWGATVRAWSVGAALAIVAWIAMRDLVTRTSRRSIVLAVIACVAASQTTYQNAVFVAAFAGAASLSLWRDGSSRRALIPPAVAAVSAASLLIYAPALVRRAAWIDVSQQPINLAQLLARLGEVLSASGPVAAATWGLALIAALLVALPRRGPDGYVALSLVFSISGLLTFYLIFGYPTQQWYYLALLAIMAVAIDAALAIPTETVWRAARVAVAGAVVATSLGRALTRSADPFTNIDVVGTRLSRDAGPSDLVIANPWYLGVSLHRYYTGAARVRAVPSSVDTRVHRFDLVKVAMQNNDPMRSLLGEIQQTLESGHRVWVVGGVTDAPPGTITALPLPPLPQTGWNSGPYEAVWSFALARLLREHAVDRLDIPAATGASSLERADLAVFRGWH